MNDIAPALPGPTPYCDEHDWQGVPSEYVLQCARCGYMVRMIDVFNTLVRIGMGWVGRDGREIEDLR